MKGLHFPTSMYHDMTIYSSLAYIQGVTYIKFDNKNKLSLKDSIFGSSVILQQYVTLERQIFIQYVAGYQFKIT